VQHTDYFDDVGANPIDIDPRRAPDNQLAGQRNSADASQARVFRQPIGRGLDALNGVAGGGRVVLAM